MRPRGQLTQRWRIGDTERSCSPLHANTQHSEPMPDLLDYRTPDFESALAALPPKPAAGLATDAHYWDAVRGLWRHSDALINLENGFWGAMTEPVKAMFQHWTDRVNHETTLLIRPHLMPLYQGLRERLAAAMG